MPPQEKVTDTVPKFTRLADGSYHVTHPYTHTESLLTQQEKLAKTSPTELKVAYDYSLDRRRKELINLRDSWYELELKDKQMDERLKGKALKLVEQVEGFSIHQKDDLERRASLLRYKDSFFLVMQKVVKGETRPVSHLSIWKMEPGKKPKCVHGWNFSYCVPQKFISFIQNGRYVYVPQVSDPQPFEKVFELKIEAVDLETLQLVELSATQVIRGKKLGRVHSIEFFGSFYDQEKRYYNRQLSHEEFLESSFCYIGILSRKSSKAPNEGEGGSDSKPAMSRFSEVKPSIAPKDPKEEESKPKSDLLSIISEQQDPETLPQQPFTMSVRCLATLDEELYFKDYSDVFSSSLVTSLNNHLIRKALKAEDFSVLAIKDDSSLVVLKHSGTVLEPIEVEQDVGDIMEGIGCQVPLMKFTTLGLNEEDHFYEPKLLQKFVGPHADLPSNALALIPHDPKWIAYDRDFKNRILFHDERYAYFGVDHEVHSTFKTDHAEEGPGGEALSFSDKVKEYVVEALSLDTPRISVNLDHLSLKLEAEIEQGQKELNAVIQDHSRGGPQMSLVFNSRLNQVQVTIKIGEDAKESFIKIEPSCGPIANIGHIQVTPSSPILKVQNKTNFIKYLQNFSLALFSERTGVMEVRELEVSWGVAKGQMGSSLLIRATNFALRSLCFATSPKSFFLFTTFTNKGVITGSQLAFTFPGEEAAKFLVMNPCQKSDGSLLVDMQARTFDLDGFKIFYSEVVLSKFIHDPKSELEDAGIFEEKEGQQILSDFSRRCWNSHNAELFEFLFSASEESVDCLLAEDFNSFMPVQIFKYRSLLDLHRSSPIRTRTILDNKLKRYERAQASGEGLEQDPIKSDLLSVLQIGNDPERLSIAKNLELMKTEFDLHFDSYYKSTLEINLSYGKRALSEALLNFIFKIAPSQSNRDVLTTSFWPIITAKHETLTSFFKFLQPPSSSGVQIEVPLDDQIFMGIEEDLEASKEVVFISQQKQEEANIDSFDFVVDSINSQKLKSKYNLIDFKQLALANKINLLTSDQTLSFSEMKERIHELDLNDLSLARLVEKTVRRSSHIDKALKQVITDQFERVTAPYFFKQLVVYSLFYLLPFFIQLVSSTVWLVEVCMVICFLTMVLLHREKIFANFQGLRRNGLQHLKSYRLKRDFTQFALFLIYFITRIIVPGQRLIPWKDIEDFNPSFLLGVVSAGLIVIAAYRLTFYLLIFDRIGFALSFFHEFLSSLKLFFCAVVALIVYFAIHFQLVGITHEYDEYPKVPRFFVYCIHVYRTMVGDSILPQYTSWVATENSNPKEFLGLLLIWLSWVVCQMVGYFLLLNYLIALILEAYDKNLDKKDYLRFVRRSMLNRVCMNQLVERGQAMPKFEQILLKKELNMKPTKDWGGSFSALKELFYHSRDQSMASRTDVEQQILSNSARLQDIGSQKTEIQKEVAWMKSQMDEFIDYVQEYQDQMKGSQEINEEVAKYVQAQGDPQKTQANDQAETEI